MMETPEQTKIQIEEYRNRFGDLITVEQVSLIADTRIRLIERMVSLELLEPCSEAEGMPCFSVESLPRIRKMLRIHNDLGVAWSSMGLVMDLLDRIEELERQASGVCQ